MMNVIDYALLSGASYYDTRAELNRFPLPKDWSLYSRLPEDKSSGFEASTYKNGSELVISYAGTYDKDISGDIATDAALALGRICDQLRQAADYYLKVKALNTSAVITFTGHSLGGGLASLMAVFFGESATTFDQAPFLRSALTTTTNIGGNVVTHSAAQDLLTYLRSRGYSDDRLAKLKAFVDAANPDNANPIVDDTLGSRGQRVTNINTDGEFLTSWPVVPTSNRIGSQAKIVNSHEGVGGTDLHSQALLTAFLLSDPTAATNADTSTKSLNRVTFKLPDLLKMIFDKNLFAFDPNNKDNPQPNFLEHIVRHQTGIGTSLPADDMVKRFTADLWKLAQEGGMTLNDGYAGNAEVRYISDALIAFAMQFYYEDTANAKNSQKQLFTDLGKSGEGSNSIRFAIGDVSKGIAAAIEQMDAGGDIVKLDAKKDGKLILKGYEYFAKYLETGQGNGDPGIFSDEERAQIKAYLPFMRDWYVQAGANGMLATDTQNRGAFMLGGNGSDILTGGTADDLLVGNAGSDSLDGGAGKDILLGGAGHDVLKGGDDIDLLLGGAGSDTLDGGKGNDLLKGGDGNDTYTFTGDYGIDIVTDSDGSGSLQVEGQTLGGGSKILENVYKDNASGQIFVKLNSGKNLVVLKEDSKNRIVVNNWPAAGNLSVNLQDTAPAVPSVTLAGDFKKKTEITPGGVEVYVIENNWNYANGGAEANAKDLITGTGGDDVINGGGGDDALSGLDGADYIVSGDGNSFIQGGLGKDTLIGGGGHDCIYGSSQSSLTLPSRVDFEKPINKYPNPMGTGFNWSSGYYETIGDQVPWVYSDAPRNRLDGDEGNYIDAGAGNDFIAAGTGADYAHGGDDNDYIFGMGKGDVLFGDGGNDYIYGDGDQPDDGRSVVWALYENHGNDVIDGGDGNDYLIGQGGADIIFGGTGNDRIWGDDGPEQLPPEHHGNDLLFGGVGDDSIIGGAGDDYLEGGADSDTLWGEVGDDVYYYNAGDGVDTIQDNSGEKNIVRFGAGVDASKIKLRIGSLMLDMGNGDALHIANFNQNDVFNSSSIGRFEFADGSYLTDKELLERGFDLDGDANANAIAGTNTTDRIRGFEGNDDLVGRGGNDSILGGTGNDSLFGDADDVAMADQGADYLNGEEGDDYLRGYAGNDVLSGGNGNDTLIGEEGDDLLSGDEGNDSLAGGMGNDRYLFNRGDGQDEINNAATDFATAVDTIELGAGISTDDVLIKRLSNDLLVEIGASDKLTVSGYFSASYQKIDQIRFADGTVWDQSLIEQRVITVITTATDGVDSIHGTDGPDIIHGLDGDDILYGDNGNDALFGDGGADLLVGGKGNDTLVGGDGNDVYRIALGSGSDTLIDAPSGSNTLRFDSWVNSDSLSAIRQGDDLRIGVYGTVDSVVISGYFLDSSPNWQVDFDGQNPVALSQIVADNSASTALSRLWAETKGSVIVEKVREEVRPQYYFDSGYSNTTPKDGTSIDLGNLLFERQATWDLCSVQVSDQTTSITLRSLSNEILSENVTTKHSANIANWFNGSIRQRSRVQYETGRRESNDAVIEHDSEFSYESSTGAAMAVIALGDQRGAQSRQWNNIQVVRNELGDPIGTQTTQNLLNTYSQYGYVQRYIDNPASIPAPVDGAKQISRVVDYHLSVQHINLVEEVVAGDADNEIRANSWATELVDGGAGNDTIISTGGTPLADLLYGNAGNDTLRGNGAILVGGEGSDLLYGGQLSDRYVFLDTTESGIDLIQDAGSSLDDYKSWFYGQQGISNYQELSPVEHWAIWPREGGSVFYSRTEMDAWFATRYPEWSVAEALASGDLVHFPALPPMLIGNSRDYALRADTGIGAQDIVVLPEGLKLADLSFSWGEHDDGDGQLRQTLDVSWNGALHARIVMPNANDPIGFGVEGFKFGNGLFVPMSQILQFAPVMPNLGDGTQIGNAQNDLLAAGNAAEALFGMAGNDTLVGGAGNDILAGGEGNDLLTGGQGNDVYVVHYSSDQDRLLDAGGVDTLQFAYDLKPEDVTVRWSGNDLVLADTARGNKITVVNWKLDAQYRIEQVRFLNGIGWDGDALIAKADAYGAIVGTDGSDSLSGNDIDNTLFGLRGNDSLKGLSGNDVYVFARDGGQDVIDQSGAAVGDHDIVRFSSGILPEDVNVFANGDDLVLRIKGSFDSLTLLGWLKGESTRISAVEFADHTVWDQETLAQLLQAAPPENEVIGTEDSDPALNGTEANDVLYGLAGNDDLAGMGGNDELHGGRGDDYLIGGAGNDAYIFQRGDGYDVVSNEDSLAQDIDLIRFGQGISPNDVSVMVDGDNLVLTVVGSEDRIDVLSWRAPVGARVASVVFADGTVWDSAELEARAGIGKTLIGSEGNDVLTGSQRNDILSGGSGDDVLTGGPGEDVLIGGLGADTYVFNLGDGEDWIDEFHTDNSEGSDSENVIRFGAGITSSDLTIQLESGNLYFSILSSGDVLGYGGKLEHAPRLEFADGEVITPSEVKAAIVNLSGDDGDNWLVGTSGNDLLQGGGGNDVITGMGGNDHMLGGSGDDSFHQNAGNDLLEGGMGGDAYVLTRTSGRDVIVEISGDASWDWLGIDRSILPEDVYYTRFAGDGDDLLITVNGSSSSLLIRDWFATTPSRLEYFSWSATNSFWESPDIESAVWGSNGSDSEAPDINDAPTGTVTVSGTATQNQTLSADNTLGDLDGLGSIGYQWQSSANGTTWSDIAGATSTNFTLTESQVGQQMRVVASYTDGHGTAESVSSGATDAVLNVNDAPTGTVTVSGTATQNQTLSAANTLGDLDGLGSIGYQWQSSANGTTWSDIAGATSTNFTLTESQVGQQMRVVASYTDGHGTPESVSSSATDAVSNVNDAPSGSVTVTGAATQYQTLSAGDTLGDLDGLGSIGYQWQSSANGTTWSDIAGATSTSFALTESQVGQRMRVVASYTDGHGTAESVSSGATDAVLNVNDAPVLSVAPNNQSATEGVAFTYVLPNGTFTDPDVGDTLAYTAKQANGNPLPAWLAFNGTTRTFTGTAGQADIGLMQIVVTATDIGGLSSSTSFQMNIAAHAPVSVIGTTGADTLYGFSGADTLDGGTGADTLIGRSGNDTYLVDNTADVVTEAANEGTDTVKSSVTYTLAANVENLALTGTMAINGTGNALDNILIGNSAANVLTGGAGNDTYYVSTGDTVTEAASAGTDTVVTDVTWALANNVENLVLTGTAAINGTGNTLNNTITGNGAANTLSGGTGADTMIGGAGNDTYVVDNTGDIVTEALNEGTDLVQSSVTYTLSANVENLTLTGTTAINGSGNALDNVLTGNSAANTLTGGAGNDTLSGGTGADTMIGGLGNDTYVVDVATDVVTEALNEGTDLVQSGVTYTLSANVENLILTGTTAINGTGNAMDNVLTGNSANNTLTGGDGNDTIDGGTGNDTMVGGLGDDTYVVNVSTDVVTEAANAGNDTIQSAVTLTLTTNVENLLLTGTTAINGTGNTLNNLVRGNTAINTLNGGTGNDILEGGDGNDILTDTSGTALFNGGAGADTLTGGASAEIFLGGLGNDTYTTAGGNDIILFNKGDGQDTFATGGTGSDTLSLGGSGLSYADLSFSKSTNDLILKVGTTDQITFKNWYAATPSKPVTRLQVMAEAMTGFAQGGSNPLLDQNVENFNFTSLVGAFDTARTANPSLTSWALTNALTNFQLAGSDTAAMGGDLAYQYGKNGTLAGIGVTPALNTLSDTNLGTNPQALNSLSSLQTGSVRLS